MDIDTIRTELARIQEELIALPEDAFDRRARLKDRQEELRGQAHQAYEDSRSPEDLRAELESLEAQWERLQDLRIDVVEQAGGGGQGGDFGQTSEAVFINNRIDAGYDRAGLEARIKRLRQRLDETG